VAVNPENPENPQILRVLPVDRQIAPGSTPPSASRTVRVLAEGSAVEDAVNGAFAVVAVAGALVRYAADRAARRGRALLPLRSSPQGRRLPSGLRGLSRALAHPAAAAVGALAAVADELVPGVTRGVLARLDIPALVREFVDVDRLAAMLDVEAVVARVDLDAVVARVDIDAVLDRLDLDAVAARLDLDALVDKVDIARVLDRVDLDAVVARVDIDAVLDRLDLDAVAARLDLDALVDKVDIARVLDRVDLDAVVAGVDLDAAVAKVDLDRAVDRVDVNRVIARTDVAGLARYVVDEIDLVGLLRASTGSVSTEVVRSVRDQGAGADRAVERVVDRLLHRQGRRTETGDESSETGRGGGRDQR
jgi:hypothetical protein